MMRESSRTFLTTVFQLGDESKEPCYCPFESESEWVASLESCYTRFHLRQVESQGDLSYKIRVSGYRLGSSQLQGPSIFIKPKERFFINPTGTCQQSSCWESSCCIIRRGLLSLSWCRCLMDYINRIYYKCCELFEMYCITMLQSYQNSDLSM